MGTPGTAPDVTQGDVRRLFTLSDAPTTPITATEVADQLDCSLSIAREHLAELADRGELRTKRLDEEKDVWWRPVDQSIADQGSDQEEFSAFVSAVKDYAIFRLDPDGVVTSWNDGAERIKGYAADDIIGEHFSTFYTEEDREDGRPDRNLSKAVENGRVEDENWRVRKDGSKFWANVIITALHDDDGDLRGFVKVTRDMTERREYEQQLEAQAEQLERQRDELEEELDDVFERIDDAFYALDEEFRFEYANDRAAEYLGTPPGELIGRSIQETLEIDEDHSLLAEFEEALATQEQRSFERYSDSIGIWEVIRIYPSESGLSVYFRDITERKRREQRLEELIDRLEESNKRLEQFAYAASHDLQEPLRMVSSYLQLLEDRYGDDLDEDGREFIEFAVDGADRMRTMIDALLKYSRVETQGEPLEPVELDAVMEDVLANLQVKIEESDTEITVEELPTVEGDASQLRQLFQNLLDNAIEYSGDEPPHVEVSAERLGSEYRISVRDEGIGIDPADQDRIFEVFQRLHLREEHTGTGIGLALCQRIAERHDGDIMIESEPGEGATFIVTLPVSADG